MRSRSMWSALLAGIFLVGRAAGAPTAQAHWADQAGAEVAVAGATGKTAFNTMIKLLTQNTQGPDGPLNLPANGNPYPSMPNSKQGGLFAGA